MLLDSSEQRIETDEIHETSVHVQETLDSSRYSSRHTVDELGLAVGCLFSSESSREEAVGHRASFRRFKRIG
jgi:hypothetical protein